MSSLDERFEHVRDAANAVTWSAPERVRGRGNQRRARRWLTTATTAVVGVVGLVAGAALAPAALHLGPPLAGATPVAPSTVPTVLHQGTITGLTGPAPIAMAYGAGSLWLAQMSPTTGSAPGTLFRVDPSTLAVLSRWPIAASPSAIVATDHYLWVAGISDSVDRFTLGADAIQQFDLSGSVVHTYSLINPLTMIGDGDSVWVEYGQPLDQLARLHDGLSDPPLHTTAGPFMPGAIIGEQPLVMCPSGIYAATTDLGAHFPTVIQIRSGRIVSQVQPIAPVTGLGCGPGQGLLAVVAEVLAQHLFSNGQASGAHVLLPGRDRSVGFCDAGAWLNDLGSNTTISFLDQSLRIGRSKVVIPGYVSASATAGCTLWLATPTPNTALTTITEVALR
jgi:hypothetical protein